MGLSQGEPEQRPVLSKVQARQGVTGHDVRYVLGFGLAAVIVVFAAVYLFYFHWIPPAARYFFRDSSDSFATLGAAGTELKVSSSPALVTSKPKHERRGAS
jgi:hypothetical protein